MNAAAAAAKRTTFFEGEITPFPNPCKFRHCIPVVADNLKRIGIFGDETTNTVS